MVPLVGMGHSKSGNVLSNDDVIERHPFLPSCACGQTRTLSKRQAQTVGASFHPTVCFRDESLAHLFDTITSIHIVYSVYSTAMHIDA